MVCGTSGGADALTVFFPLLACPDIEVQGVFYRSAQATIKTGEVQCNCCSEKLDFAIGPMGERASLEKIAFKYK